MIDSVVQFPVICGLGTYTNECSARNDGVLARFFMPTAFKNWVYATEISKLDQSGD